LTGRKIPFDPCELSTPRIHQAVLEAIAASGARPSGSHLDIESGGGQLLRLIGGRYPVKSFACDYTDQLMELAAQEVQLADLNREPLPYASNQFSLVTCIETIEHIENFRGIVREIHRVLQPGGLAVPSLCALGLADPIDEPSGLPARLKKISLLVGKKRLGGSNDEFS